MTSKLGKTGEKKEKKRGRGQENIKMIHASKAVLTICDAQMSYKRESSLGKNRGPKARTMPGIRWKRRRAGMATLTVWLDFKLCSEGLLWGVLIFGHKLPGPETKQRK